jgi:hypothetical protein
MAIVSKRRMATRVGDHVCPMCGGPGRFYRVGRQARLQTLCFSCRSHGTLLTATPHYPSAPRAA